MYESSQRMNSEDRKNEAINSSVDDAAELGERLIESLTKSTILEHVPVMKWGVSIVRGVSSVRDMLLARRISAFLQDVKNSVDDSWNVADTISRLNASRHYAEKVGEHLIERLERIDGQRKARMIAAVLVAFGKRKINEDEFYRLLRAVEVVHLPDLPSLRNIEQEGPMINSLLGGPSGRKFNPSRESLQSLLSANLVENVQSAAIGSSQQPGWWHTTTGKKFIELRLDLIEYENVK